MEVFYLEVSLVEDHLLMEYHRRKLKKELLVPLFCASSLLYLLFTLLLSKLLNSQDVRSLLKIYSYVSDFLWPKVALLDLIILSQINALFSVFSDLLESFFKRCAGVKVSIWLFVLKNAALTFY